MMVSKHILVALAGVLIVMLASCAQQSPPGELGSSPIGESPVEPQPAAPPIVIEQPQQPTDQPASIQVSRPRAEEVKLVTSDGFNLSATIYRSDAPVGVILLPMMGRDRSSYDPIITNLITKFAVIAVDLRGHGRSQGNYNRFQEEAFLGMVNDVAAARQALGKERVAIVGASIGANVGFKYAVNDPSVRTVVMISPGFEYRGVKVSSQDVGAFDRPILMVASKGDSYSHRTVRDLSVASNMAFQEVFEGDKHGTDIFATGTILEGEIMKWLSAKLE